MEVYETEDQQIEALKKWWKENGRSIVAGLVIGLGGVFGWKSWLAYQHNQAVTASVGYQQLVDLVATGKATLAKEQGERLLQQFPKGAYAALTSLLLGKVAADQGNPDEASGRFEWVIENAPIEPLKNVARLDLARLLLGQGRTEEAMATLSDPAPPRFAAAYAELKGDILVAKGDKAGARREYELALASPEGAMADRELLQMKLDDLGSGMKAVAAAKQGKDS